MGTGAAVNRSARKTTAGQVDGRGPVMLVAAAVLSVLLLSSAAVPTAVASEYPERECCDPVEPPPASASGTPNYAAAAAAGHTTVEGTPPAEAPENSAVPDVRRGTSRLTRPSRVAKHLDFSHTGRALGTPTATALYSVH